jgi:hypothetical protein
MSSDKNEDPVQEPGEEPAKRPYLKEDDPRRNWITLGDLEASYGGGIYVDIRGRGEGDDSFSISRVAVERVLDLFTSEPTPPGRYMRENDPRYEWIKFGDLEARYDGVMYATIRGQWEDGKSESMSLTQDAVRRVLELFGPEPAAE